jgi:hypothetical protein
MTESTICCPGFRKSMHHFRWMKSKEGFYMMPHFPCKDADYRVNFCPVCGVPVRDIVLSKETFKRIAHE